MAIFLAVFQEQLAHGDLTDLFFDKHMVNVHAFAKLSCYLQYLAVLPRMEFPPLLSWVFAV